MKEITDSKKELINGIFQIALSDALAFKNPRNFIDVARVRFNKEEKVHETYYKYYVISKFGKIKKPRKKKYRQQIDGVLKCRNKKIPLKLNKEVMSWDARRFLNKDNP